MLKLSSVQPLQALPMSQMSFSDFEYAGKRKQTRRERFLAERLPGGRRSEGDAHSKADEPAPSD